ncbi:hypothetical protein ECTW14313_3677, partial [Escherichia coli O157:H7 str. TW14313]
MFSYELRGSIQTFG